MTERLVEHAAPPHLRERGSRGLVSVIERGLVSDRERLVEHAAPPHLFEYTYIAV